MFMPIFQHVPRWVWLLLAALIALGMLQTPPRRLTLRRATLMPVAMLVLSWYGVVSVFTFQALALTAWAVGVAGALALTAVLGAWKNIRWSEPEQRLIVPGSWVPLLLILGLFSVKFGVGITLALHAEQVHNLLFATLVSLAYGMFSGSFLARGMMMWQAVWKVRCAWQPDVTG